MSRVESLQLLSEVIDGLEPIGQMSPGVPLRANDWNALVGAVTSLARLVASRERTTDSLLDERYSPIDHAHTGKIGLAWFDPQTRALVEEGVGGAVEQRAGLRELRADLGALRKDLGGLRDQVNALRTDLDGLRDGDSARERHISDVEIRVEALRDVERDMAGLNERFSGIGTELQAALAFREQLVDAAGNPIDVQGMNTRVTELEGIRENLRTADGEVVLIREIESALARLEENAINRNDLDDVVLQRLRDGEILNEAGLISSVTGEVESGFTTRFDELTVATTGLSDTVNVLEGGLASQSTQITGLSGRLGTAEDGLVGLGTLPAQVADHTTRLGTVEATARANQTSVGNLSGLNDRMGAVEGRVTGLEGLGVQVQGIDSRVLVVEDRVSVMDDLSANVDNLGSRIGQVEGRLPGLEAQGAQVTSNANALNQLTSRVTANEAELDNMVILPERVTALTNTVQGLSNWRTGADSRLASLEDNQRFNSDLVARVDRVEEVSAENSSSIRTLNTRGSTGTGGVITGPILGGGGRPVIR